MKTARVDPSKFAPGKVISGKGSDDKGNKPNNGKGNDKGNGKGNSKGKGNGNN